MSEKEKLIELIKQNGVYNGSSMGIEYYVVESEWLADTLIENGIGDIAEWKKRAEVAEHKLFDLAMLCVAADCRSYGKSDKEKEESARKLFNEWLQQAEEEIEEERK